MTTRTSMVAAILIMLVGVAVTYGCVLLLDLWGFLVGPVIMVAAIAAWDRWRARR